MASERHDPRLKIIVKATLQEKSTRETVDMIDAEFGSGYGDASNLNIIRATRRVITLLREMGAINRKFTGKRL